MTTQDGLGRSVGNRQFPRIAAFSLCRVFGFVAATLFLLNTFAQTSTYSQDADGLGKKTFERIEKAGQFSGCELHFSYLFQDRNRGGSLVIASGLVSAAMSNGLSLVLYESIQTSVIAEAGSSKQEPTDFLPSYISLTAGNASLEQFAYRGPPLSCSPGAICKGFVDNPKAELLLKLLESTYKPFEFVVTTTKDGVDKKVDFGRLAEFDSKPPTYDSKLSFFSCVNEIAGVISHGAKQRHD